MQILRIWDKDKDNIRTNVHNRLKLSTLNPKENDMAFDGKENSSSFSQSAVERDL